MTTHDEKAKAAGLVFHKSEEPSYLNLCVRSGNLLFTSGHTSEQLGKLGESLSTEQGCLAARQAMADLLNSVWSETGTLNGLRVLRLLGCVNATPDFKECSKVINGASDLVHEIFGKERAGFHARSALGFSTLPSGVAVEIEAVLEILP